MMPRNDVVTIRSDGPFGGNASTALAALAAAGVVPTTGPSPKKPVRYMVPVGGYSGRMGSAVPRNAKCPCGSGRKYKVCGRVGACGAG